MYCKKCKFHSFDHVSACPKCGADWEESRKALFLNWLTASGVNWVSPEVKPEAAALAKEEAVTAGATDDLFPEIPPAPSVPTSKSEDLDVSLFPELDLSMTDSTPAAPAPKHPKTQAKDDDAFVDSLPMDDMVELDFSVEFEEPAAPKAPAASKAKREELFIPELEEMLAPLTEEPRTTPAPAKKPAFTEETDILLDFGAAPTEEGKPKSDADDIPLLTLEDTSK